MKIENYEILLREIIRARPRVGCQAALTLCVLYRLGSQSNLESLSSVADVCAEVTGTRKHSGFAYTLRFLESLELLTIKDPEQRKGGDAPRQLVDPSKLVERLST